MKFDGKSWDERMHELQTKNFESAKTYLPKLQGMIPRNIGLDITAFETFYNTLHPTGSPNHKHVNQLIHNIKRDEFTEALSKKTDSNVNLLLFQFPKHSELFLNG